MKKTFKKVDKHGENTSQNKEIEDIKVEQN